MKFRILPKIHDFSDAYGNVYRPGDTVDLPEEQYLGLPWLEPIEEKPIKLEKEDRALEFDVSQSPVEPVEEPQPERRRARRNA